ncbi:MAG: VTT domain-containing protein [Anaerolineales bacterium]|nr:VTT domain-containing protein [Anaerolineales bacterium]
MTSTSQQTKTDWRLTVIRIGVIVGLLALSVLFYLFRDQVRLLQYFGYPGIFLLNLIASASIILPIPALPFVFGMAALETSAGVKAFSVFWLGVAAAIGSSIGELSGYAAGYSGRAVIERSPLYDRLHEWTERYGVAVIVILAFIPNPLFDMAGIAAGTLRMPLWKFFVATLAGKLVKMWLVAYAGANAIGWVARLMGLP